MFSSRVATIAALAFACLGSAAAAEGEYRVKQHACEEPSLTLTRALAIKQVATVWSVE